MSVVSFVPLFVFCESQREIAVFCIFIFLY
jgi:hypothetical protein